MECHKNEDQCPHAENAADAATKKVFAIMGVNVDDPESVEQFRMDLRFGGKLRRAADKGFIFMVLGMLGFLGGAMVVGIQAALRGTPG